MPAPSPPPPLAETTWRAARHVASVARELVRPSLGRPPGAHVWTSRTQVQTVDDEIAGAALAERFAASFPGHGLVIEDLPPVDGDGASTWYIDPIDGSANHLRGIPYVAVSAGLASGDELVAGVVHDVVGDRTLCAWRGGGAHVLGPAASEDTDPASAPATRVADTGRLADAMAILHVSRRGPLLNREGALADVLWHVRKFRCMGSIALDLMLLACGEADLLVAGRGRPQRLLDIAGGLVALREAGGAAVTARGDPFHREARTLIAGVPALVDAFVELLARYDLEGWAGDQARPPAR